MEEKKTTLKKLTKEQQAILEDAVPRYGDNKKIESDVKKVLAEDNKTIKTILAGCTDKKFTAGGYTATYSISESKDINEEKLLQMLLERYKDTSEKLGIIKTQQYVDTKLLTDLAYSNKLPKELIIDMDKCKEVNTTAKLLIKKTKEDK